MSNLGTYQWITTAAKKVGGPVRLLLLVAGSGYLIIRSAEFGGKQIYRIIKGHKGKTFSKITSNALEYTVTKEGVSNENIKFSVGEKFCILEADGDAILVDKKGDPNSPYFVSKELLMSISEYNGNDKR